jgi:hypothetical protein
MTLLIGFGYLIIGCGVLMIAWEYGRSQLKTYRRNRNRGRDARREARRIRNRNYVLARRHQISLRREDECAW